MAVKIIKKKIWCIFDPDTRVCDFNNGAELHLCDNFSWVDFICLVPFF